MTPRRLYPAIFCTFYLLIAVLAVEDGKGLSIFLKSSSRFEADPMASTDVYPQLSRQEKDVFLSAVGKSFEHDDMLGYLQTDSNFLNTIHVFPVGFDSDTVNTLERYLNSLRSEIHPIAVLNSDIEENTANEMPFSSSHFFDVVRKENEMNVFDSLEKGFKEMIFSQSGEVLYCADVKIINRLVERNLDRLKATRPGTKLFVFNGNILEQEHDYAYCQQNIPREHEVVTPSRGEQCISGFYISNSSYDYIWTDVAAGPLYYGKKYEDGLDIFDWMYGKKEFDFNTAVTASVQIRDMVRNILSPPMVGRPFVSLMDEKIEVNVYVLHDYVDDSGINQHKVIDLERVKTMISSLLLPGTKISMNMEDVGLHDCEECAFATKASMKTHTSYTDDEHGFFTLSNYPYIDSLELRDYLRRLGNIIGRNRTKEGKEFRVFIVDLDRSDVMLLDKQNLYVVYSDMVIIPRTRAGEVTFNYACGVVKKNKNPVPIAIDLSQTTERLLFGSLITALFGVSPPRKVYSHEKHAVYDDYVWSCFSHNPFGYFSPPLKSYTEIPLSVTYAAKRNVIVSYLNDVANAMGTTVGYFRDNSMPIFRILENLDRVSWEEGRIRWSLYRLKVEQCLYSLSLNDHPHASFYARSILHERVFFDLVFNYILKETTTFSLTCAADVSAAPGIWFTNLFYNGLIYVAVAILWIVALFYLYKFYDYAWKKEQ